MRRFPQKSRRGGFTLVELLVVITIIAILFGLIAAATVKLVGKGDELKVRNEVSQLAQAVQAFKQQFAVGYMPDLIYMPPGADPSGFSQQYVKSVWPRLNPAALGTAATAMTINGVNYPRGVFDYWGVPGNSAVILQGDQSLVFWLSGPRDVISATAPGNVLGFCSDPTDPMNRTSTKRISPFYDFPADRLAIFPTDTARTAPFPSFKDTYGAAPYLYFATGKADNAYPNTLSLSTSVVISPYRVSATKFANPNSFQIISAGKDMSFGAGGLQWAGAVGGGATQTGYDDVANFHPTFLGIQAQ